MAFHPYPQLIRAVFNPQRFGPPQGITLASAWPWIDHSGFGSGPTDFVALLRLAFASAPPQNGLTSPARSNSPDHNAKGTRSDCSCPKTEALLPPLVGMWFQDLFHPPPGVLFTFPSRYWFTIGHRLVFSLGRWSCQVQSGFHVSRPTQVPVRTVLHASPTGLSPPLAALPSALWLTHNNYSESLQSLHDWSYNPV